MNDNNELTQEQANKEIINAIRDLTQEVKLLNENILDLKQQGNISINKLEAIRDNTGFYIIIFAIKVIIYILLIVLAGKGAYDLLQFLF